MYKAAIIGLGNIGQGYDYHNHLSDEKLILTHATAYTQHPDYQLVAAVDLCSQKRQAFSNKFKKPTYNTLADLFYHHQVDIVSVCVPTQAHMNTLIDLLSFPVKALLMEKPLSLKIHEAREMVRLAKNADTTLIMNMIRVTEPGWLSLAKALKSGTLGEPLKAALWYSGQFQSNAIHYIHMVNQLLGPIHQQSFISEGDRSDFILHTRYGPVYCLHHETNQYFLSEMEIFTDKGKIHYSQDGQEVVFYPLKSDDNFNEVQTIDFEQPKYFAGDFSRYQFHMLEHVTSVLKGDQCSQSQLMLYLESETILHKLNSTIKEEHYA